MKREQIAALDAKARAHFTYFVDDVMKWRSHADDVLAGNPWKGYCADLVSTVNDLLGREGELTKDRYRLLVSTTDRAVPDHTVGAVQCDDGTWLIVGDTNAAAYPAPQMDYRPIYYNRLSEAGSNPTWRFGVPWKAAS